MQEYPASPKEAQLATQDDLLALFGLIDAANRLAAHKTGLPAWVNIEATHVSIKKHVEADDVYVVRNPEDEIYASLTLKESSDVWGEWGQDGRAIYITQYMKDPEKVMQGDPKTLLRFVAHEAARRNKPLIRLDAVEDQAATHFKRDLGFEEKGRFTYRSSGRVGILLENTVENLKARLEAWGLQDNFSL